ncbi:hypothetical protein J4441_00925 [Candidatus Micrarchaeota archaeon]|nr:hypothetical protein [Candidatus Micrarchaeota archaeon]
MAEGIVSLTLKSYMKNTNLMLFFSLPALFAFAMPVLVGTPSYNALGGIFLRTGSIPDLSEFGIGVMVVALLASLYLLSFALVNLNIVVKSQRTSTSIKNEVFKGITTYTVNVFWIFLVAQLLLLIVQLLTFGMPMQGIIAPVLSLAIVVPALFAPAALVIDGLRPFRALQKSVEITFTKLHYVALWVAISICALSVVDGIALFLLPHGIGTWAAVLLNALIIMPFSVVMLAQIYMSKYTIIS